MAIHQLGNSLLCVGQFLNSGAGATGLSVNVDVYKIPLAAGSPVTLVSGGAATELARGGYWYRLTSGVDAAALYVFVFYTAGTADQKVVVQGWTAGMAWTEAIDQAITSAVAAVLAKLPSALVGGRIDASVGAMAPDTLTSSALAASAVVELQTGLATSAAVASVQADTDDIQGRLPAALVSGRMDAHVGAMGVDTLTAAALAADAVDEIADASGGGDAGDPWITPLPGSYPAGTAGAILGNLESDILAGLGSTEITLVSPLLEGGVLELVAGDAYDLDHGRALDDWALTGQPSLVGATVTFVIDGVLTVEAISLGGAGSGTQTPVFELTAADTALLTRVGERSYRYQIQAVWPADSPNQPAVLTRGDVTVVDRAVA